MTKFAVIDIGSNSVRLVVYENLNRAPYVVFNEKILCGLGRGVSESGLMMEAPMERAISSMKRFAILIDEMDISIVKTVATSAVRDAKNGVAFADKVLAECGIKVDIISGKEEARLSGLGVICGIPDAVGIAGDLGGGSLELIKISNGAVDETVSLPLGPLQFQDKKWHVQSPPKKEIYQHLESVEWFKESKGARFYVVGGAWRTLARIHMSENGYPHNNIQHYEIPVNEALALSRKISRMSRLELEVYLVHVSTRRLKVLALASLVFYQTLKKLKPSAIIISAYGLREGVVYDAMSQEVRDQDLLIEDCKSIAKMTGRFPEHGKKLSKFIGPLFHGETALQTKLRLAVCILSDVGWRGLPDYRSDKVISEIMFGRIHGLDHASMAFVALSLYVCYGGNIENRPARVAKSLLMRKDIITAQQIGLALRLARRMSGGTLKGMKVAELKVSSSKLTLFIKKSKAAIYNELVESRLNSLAKEFGLEEMVEFY